MLQSGSAVARALHELWQGEPVVRLEPDPGDPTDELVLACQLLGHLFSRTDAHLHVVFAANHLYDLDLRTDLTRIFTTRIPGEPAMRAIVGRPLPGPWPSCYDGRAEFEVGVRTPRSVWNVGDEADLVVIDPRRCPRAVLHPAEISFVARGVLLLNRPGAPKPDAGPAHELADGHARNWGVPPLEVVLAGVPT